jgi:DNA-binding XRE family transcriptional regulator
MREKDLLIQLGEQIRRFRKESGLTQQELADKVGTSLDTIGNLERGEFFTSLWTLYQISWHLGRNLDELFAWAPRVRKSKAEAAIDNAVGRFKSMLTSTSPVTLADANQLLAILADKPTGPEPKKPRKRAKAG